MGNLNAFERHEESKNRLKNLYERYTYAALYLLATDLRLDTESLLRIIGGLQGMSQELRKRINLLWVIKFGTTYFPAPRPVLEPEMETMEKGSAFFYRDPLYGEKDPYKDLVLWDILPNFISEQDYNNALTRVRNKIIPLMDEFYKTLHVEPTENISVATLYGPERREHRTFELHLIDRETDRNTDIVTYKVKYALAYSQGEMQVCDGNLPVESILNILRAEGDWQS